MSVASRLSEAGHYASQQIKQISTQLDQEWKSFAAALDERSTILAMSAVFHQKAEQVRTHIHTLHRDPKIPSNRFGNKPYSVLLTQGTLVTYGYRFPINRRGFREYLFSACK